MKTLHRYITGQVLASLLLTVAVAAFVVLLMNTMHDVLPLLLSGRVPLSLAARAIALELPFACVYGLPMGFVTATLLVFARFSADQELTAMRASGISLLSLIMPVLLLSLVCCGFSAWLNLEIGPRSRVALLKMIRFDLVHQMGSAAIPEGQLVDLKFQDKRYQFYVGKNHGGELEDVNVYRMQTETNWDVLIHAPRGRLLGTPGTNELVVQLMDGRILHGQSISAFGQETFNFSASSVTNRAFKPSISDMTYAQLREELRLLQRENLRQASLASPAALADLDHLNLSVKTNASPAEVRALLRQAAEIRDGQISRVQTTMHGEIAFSFACFGFTLIGIPLGLRVHRRETNIGIALALGLVAVYYGFVMLGDSLSARPEFYPHLILWVPNFLFQGIGAALLWRANRGIG